MNGFLAVKQWSAIVPREDDKIFVPTVQRTFRILEVLATTENGCGISELSHELGFAKSTTFNILMTLAELGYIYRTQADNKFHLSLKLFSLGSTVVDRMDLRKIAASILQDLVDTTGETVNLGTIQGDEAVYIDCLPGPQPVTVHTWPGKRLPLHSTALGKALLGWLPEKEAKAILSSSDIPEFTADPVPAMTQLFAELTEVRSRGYSIDNEEDAEGMRCVGAPVFDHNGAVLAAISVTAPVQRLPLENIPGIARLVVEGAEKISQRLGFAPEIHVKRP
ncbi:MAG: IclR family transcriptional regulator [Anaerolineae bacterium]|nr:IclR family transcriptional regulator [Anaerolineae bacterium]